jgi:DNA-binding NarL/FixJ family response regulator
MDRVDPTTASRESGAAPGPRRRIAVAARPALFGEVLALKLRDEPGLEVSGVAGDEEELRLLVARGRPEVLLFDYEGLGPGAELVIRRLRRVSRATRVLVLATRSSEETLERVLHAGASGLVGKQQSYETLVRAIHAVFAGELWANRVAAAHVVEHIAASPLSAGQLDERLTRREWQIVDAVGRGTRNREIAKSLRISEKTVKSHLNNIFRKLRVGNRFAVGLYSLERDRERA